jgi:hypothetical protein
MKSATTDVSKSVSDAKPAIWHPVIDFLLVGGASIIGGIALIVWFTNNQEWVKQFDRYTDNAHFRDIGQFWLFWILGLVINFPHLMASYRILYRSKSQIVKFRWSAIYVPGILLVLCIATLIALMAPAETSQNVRLQFAAVVNSNNGLATYIFTGLLVLILCGYLVFIVPGSVIVVNNWSLHLLFVFNLLVIAVNIHHCFVDGQIWKLSNLEIQRTLFAHLGER